MEDLGFGIETMGQRHAKKAEQEHGVTRARVDDLGRRVCNESPAVGPSIRWLSVNQYNGRR